MSSPTHEFTLILSGFSELTEDVMNALYEAGCDDGLLCLDKIVDRINSQLLAAS